MNILNRIDESIKRLTPYQPGKPIIEVAREKGIANIVKLASNENQLGASPKALEALQNVSAFDLSRYPDANGTLLINALSESLKLPSSHIVLGNGSNEILELTAHLFLDSNTACVFSAHAFIVYYLATVSRRATPVIVKANHYAHDLNAIAEAANKENVGVVFIANPNNPTGTWHNANAIADCLRKIPSHVLVVLDEAYCEYLPPEQRPTSLPLLKLHPNLVITRTFSKIYGLAGLRIGYGIANPEIIQLFNRVRQPFNVNSIAQAAALAALGDLDHLDKSHRINAEGLAQLTAMMDENEIEYIPSYGNFIAFKPPVDAKKIYNTLLNAGIIARQLNEYDMPDWLRITIGTKQENQRVIDSLLLIKRS